jgi:hypothetical protein
MYLESSSLDNNRLYAKFGFELRGELRLARGAAPVFLYLMVREPRPSRLQASVTQSSNEDGAKA